MLYNYNYSLYHLTLLSHLFDKELVTCTVMLSLCSCGLDNFYSLRDGPVHLVIFKGTGVFPNWCLIHCPCCLCNAESEDTIDVSLKTLLHQSGYTQKAKGNTSYSHGSRIPLTVLKEARPSPCLGRYSRGYQATSSLCPLFCQALFLAEIISLREVH